jgi:hypothetical protein
MQNEIDGEEYRNTHNRMMMRMDAVINLLREFNEKKSNKENANDKAGAGIIGKQDREVTVIG